MEVLTSKQMEMVDKEAIETLKIPSIVLMENAAISFVQEIENDINRLSKGCVVCGVGNNGGDGFAIARHLFLKGYFVDVISINSDKLKNDAKINYEILQKFPVRIFEDYKNVDFNIYDYIVDAIFGTGLTRRVEGDIQELILKINALRCKVFSVDIPSGLSGSSSEVLGVNIKAHKTVTFCRPKIPHTLYPAKQYCGEVVVKYISIPDFLVNKFSFDNFLLTKESLPVLKNRTENTHKGHYGHTVIIGGSKGKIGAAIMAAYASIRAGSGLTTAVIPSNFIGAIHSKLPEAMCLDIKSCDFLKEEDAKTILEFIKDKSCIGIGPGLGTNPSTKNLLKTVVKETDNKLVIDADGLNLLDEEMLTYLKFRAVITPHIGEFCRMLKISKDELMEDRLNICKKFAIENSIYVVLKSADTIIAYPDGKCFIFNEGSPALAKGGSGDILTGILSSLISQGVELGEAAKLSVFLHGRSGKILADKYNTYFPKASEVCENLWVAMNEILQDSK
jgi:NAD(P)H-hydrate epimerase